VRSLLFSQSPVPELPMCHLPGKPCSTPRPGPSSARGWALPRWRHRAGQGGQARGQREGTRCLLTVSALRVSTTFSTPWTLVSWKIVSGAVLPQIRFFFLLVDLPWGTKSILKSVEVVLRDLVWWWAERW